MHSSFHGILRFSGSKFFIKSVRKCSGKSEIVFPQRIRRGPTDVLRALSNTVKCDPTAPHYKYHDDPFLIPYSNLSKRAYALSQEAGRKAAQWIRQEHADLFQHKVADPPIEAFVPKPVLDDTSDVNESNLVKAINNCWVSDAVNIYTFLKQKNIVISWESKQSLLELLCFYNAEDPLHEDWIEEKWFRSGKRGRALVKKTWKDGSFAEDVFNELEPHDSKSYSALISGMCLHGQLNTAWKLYKESEEQNICLSVVAFNALISRVNFMRESHELMWALIMEHLQSMKKWGLHPNLGTLNAILESLSLMSTSRKAKMYALQAVAEFKNIGIEPGLAGYYHLLNIFYAHREDLNDILYSILNHIEGKSFEVSDVKDTFFFMRAMEVCRNFIRDKNLGYQIHNLLHTSDNYNLIGDSFKESNYYRHFFGLLSETETIDTFMELYEKLVPNVYIPEPSVMKEILCAVEMNAAWNFLPKLWSDIVLFDHSLPSVFEKLLEILASIIGSEIKNEIVKIAWEVWEKIQNEKFQQRERNLTEWTGKMYSNFIKVFLQNGDKRKAEIVFDKLDKSQSSIVGEPDVVALQLLLDACIEDSSVDTAIKCIRYCNEIGFLETESMAQHLFSSQLRLSDEQKDKLYKMFDKKIFEIPSSD